MSWFTCGNGLAINGSAVVRTQTQHSSAYGAPEVADGKHEWKIKVASDPSSCTMIGIASDTTHLNSNLWQTGDAYDFYGWFSSSPLYHNATYINYPNHQQQPRYTQTDTVTVHLDLDNATLAFSKNDQHLGTAFTKISKKKYRLAVGTIYAGAKFEMVSYRNLSEETKEETKEEKTVHYIEQCIKSVVTQNNALKEQYSNEKMKKFDFDQLKNVATYFNELENNIKTLENELKKCKEVLSQSQNELRKYMVLDTKEYKTWTLKQVEIWLYSLEKGKYKKYIPKLIQGFAADQITASDLPDLDQGDLRQFGVALFKDRKNLKSALSSLKTGSEGSETALVQ